MCFSLNVMAQLKKGSKLVGGNLLLELSTPKTKSGGTTTTSGKLLRIDLEPRFGYFLINNFAMGGELGIAGSNWKPEDKFQADISSSSISIGPFVRYYLPANVFIEGKYAIGIRETEHQNGFDLETDEYKIRKVAFAIGYALFLNDNVAIEPMFGYQSVAEEPRFYGSIIDIDNSLFIRLGFQVYLRNRN